MKTLSMYEVQGNLSSVLDMIEKQGKKYSIFRDGKPVADLLPHKSQKQNDLIDSLTDTGICTPPSKPVRKASIPGIKVKGRKMSEIIAEDRR